MTETNGPRVWNDVNPYLHEAPQGVCLGLLEVGSVARGVEVADAVLKAAAVDVLVATPVQPGKFVVLFTGEVADVASSVASGRELAGPDLVDLLHLPQVHEQVPSALRRQGGTLNGHLDAIGVVETGTVASAVHAADLAVKTSTVDLLSLRIANGLGGKSYFTITGEVSDVRSSVVASGRQAEAAGQLLRQVVIPGPHPELVRHL